MVTLLTMFISLYLCGYVISAEVSTVHCAVVLACKIYSRDIQTELTQGCVNPSLGPLLSREFGGVWSWRNVGG
jgi:hypothetical protein